LAVGACTHTPEQVAVAADALQTASLPGSVTLSTKTTTVVPGEPVTIEDKRDWIEMPYAVTRAELKELYAMPPIETAPQFQFSTLVPPGAELWDPFDIHVQSSESFLVGDDAKSGRIWQVNIDGSVKSVAAPERFAPYTFDIAPASFGRYAGHIYALAFNEPTQAGGWELADAIIRVDPNTGEDTLVCYLPDNETGAGAGGFFVRFGPPNTPFADKLWITTASNHSIYHVAADGTCSSFVTIDLDRWGSPRGIGFTPDGKSLLLATAKPDAANRAKTLSGGGKILLMSADGAIADKPVATGLHEPGQMAYAPNGFGNFAGELFVADAGDWHNERGIAEQPNKGPTETVGNDGRVFRVTSEGKLELVASGLRNPVGVGFLGNALAVGDINGDFHIGYQKFPDGFVILIKPK